MVRHLGHAANERELARLHKEIPGNAYPSEGDESSTVQKGCE